MCGIIAYIGNDIFSVLIKGLELLQNRGYDSAGICSIKNEEFILDKLASDNNNAIQNLKDYKEKYENCNIGIAHTRWATHGGKTDINAHPHIDYYNTFSIVHNGIIENYLEIKELLEKEGYIFKSDCDSEVICNYLSYQYKKLGDTKLAILKMTEVLEGTYGIVILKIDEPNKLYCIRLGSPLLIGINNKEAFIVSESLAFQNRVNNYFCLGNNDLCIIEYKDDKITYTNNNNYQLKKNHIEENKLSPDPYPYWLIKEIEEQPKSFLRAIGNGGRLYNDEIKLGGMNNYKDELKNTKNIILLGCGTSLNAGYIARYFFKEYNNFNSIQVFDGSEFEINDIPKNGRTVIILISQSGETKDLIRCIPIARKKNIILIGVCNVVDSYISREVDCGCYLNAGRENSVASTKAFTSQVIVLILLSLWFSQLSKSNNLKRKKVISDLRKLYLDIEICLGIKNEVKKYVNMIDNKKFNSVFILGKGKNKFIADEGALKIKEISYIHAEGYSGSSLKHGPFGLLEKGFPVILVDIDDEYHNKMNNVYEEVKSRGANVITITDDVNMIRENKILVPKNKNFSFLLSVIPFQYLAYYLSLNRGHNPDYPRNLAKVVTVE